MSASTPSRRTSGSSASGQMKIGELARKTGKSVRALRHYEELGLLGSARSEGGFRLYGADELARVYWISKLQDMGFSLTQVQGLIATVESSGTAPEAMQSLREMFRSRLLKTREQVERLLQLERDLAESLAYLEGCRVCTSEHDLEGCASCDSPVHSDTRAPSLVAGVRLTTAPTARTSTVTAPPSVTASPAAPLGVAPSGRDPRQSP
ncbi:MerR family transcriptional regulator [Paraliomyxa miuraensis]|uniref:MerR family transcriptional regulator n=1 Tax=Paraliomyxa miuraensis TaxID=376150 RepID=UPI002257AF98|nr:MerR family transcriptional regulator [Paraliomyxa miuraensis]MCX4242858.1 MerR family transcriptional regulator [Paraliomyxa miuraensis]